MGSAFHIIRDLPAWSAPAAPRVRNSRVTRANSFAAAQVGRHLRRLRDEGRRAVAIVDLACGDGSMAVAAARRARALGFVAITVRGFDPSGPAIAAARRNARALGDPAIGCDFAVLSTHAAPPIEEAESDLLLLGPDRVHAQAGSWIASDGMIVRHR